MQIRAQSKTTVLLHFNELIPREFRGWTWILIEIESMYGSKTIKNRQRLSGLVVSSFIQLFRLRTQYRPLPQYPNIKIQTLATSAWNLHTVEPAHRISPLAGEVIIIQGSSFRYTGFSDAGSYIPPDYKGGFSSFADHIYLNDSRVPSPFRVAGIADGAPVLLTREGYEQWQKTGSVAPGEILYLQKAK